MLRVSKLEYLFDPLQQLLSPSVVNHRAWSHRRLLRSMQRGTQIKPCTKRLLNCIRMAVLLGCVMLKVSLLSGSYKSAPIAAKFWLVRQLVRPPAAAAAAAVEEQSCVLFSIAALLLRPFSIAAAAVEEETAILLLLRPFSIAAFLFYSSIPLW